ncbi:MAG: THUMP domain-containing class I SAM-dependent RNA methyltransferase [Bacteroidia bacterium]|jgi:putative N6-adenine-specific DNA methylase
MAQPKTQYHPSQGLEKIPFVATCLAGFEEQLLLEVERLGISDAKIELRRIEGSCSWAQFCLMAFKSRLAVRLLLPLCKVMMRTSEDLYKAMVQYPWEDWIDPSHTIAIDHVVYSRFFNNTTFPALRLKDAIVDRIRDKKGKRPGIDKESPSIRVHLHVSESNVTVSLDASGFSLQRRGYRHSGGIAPLSEVLAAGMIDRVNWDGQKPLIDPFCGGATLLIEAVRRYLNVPSAIDAPDFCLRNWPIYDEKLWYSLSENALQDFKKPMAPVMGFDRSPSSVSLAKHHIQRAGLEGKIEVFQDNAMKWTPTDLEVGTLVANPPYGERIPLDDPEQWYQNWGFHLKHHFSGWTLWVLSTNSAAMKRLGFKHSDSIALKNGTLDCLFRRYNLYSGKKSTGPGGEVPEL